MKRVEIRAPTPWSRGAGAGALRRVRSVLIGSAARTLPRCTKLIFTVLKGLSEKGPIIRKRDRPTAQHRLVIRSPLYGRQLVV